MTYSRWYFIRMSYGNFIMPRGWQTLTLKSFGWQIHLTKSFRWLSSMWYLIRMTYDANISRADGLAKGNISLCHLNDIPYRHKSFGWISWSWYLSRTSYGKVIMSSGWHTLPLLSHPDETADFDFSQHAVVLQCFPLHAPVSIQCRYHSHYNVWTHCGYHFADDIFKCILLK